MTGLLACIYRYFASAFDPCNFSSVRVYFYLTLSFISLILLSYSYFSSLALCYRSFRFCSSISSYTYFAVFVPNLSFSSLALSYNFFFLSSSSFLILFASSSFFFFSSSRFFNNSSYPFVLFLPLLSSISFLLTFKLVPYSSSLSFFSSFSLP